MTTYAKDTRVGIDASRKEIEQTLERFGVEGFVYGWHEGQHIIAFQHQGIHIKYLLPIPPRTDFAHTAEGYRRSDKAIESAYQQGIKERWRAFALLIKAKLAAVEAGIVTFEEEFLAPTVTPSGVTVGQWFIPQIQHTIASGTMPPLLPGPKD